MVASSAPEDAWAPVSTCADACIVNSRQSQTIPTAFTVTACHGWIVLAALVSAAK
jgi:hypothetical protein